MFLKNVFRFMPSLHSFTRTRLRLTRFDSKQYVSSMTVVPISGMVCGSDEQRFNRLNIKAITNEKLEKLKKVIDSEYQLSLDYVFAISTHCGRKYFVVLKSYDSVPDDNTSYYIDIIEKEYVTHQPNGNFEIKQIVDLDGMDTVTQDPGIRSGIRSGITGYHTSIQGAFFLQQDIPAHYTGNWFFCAKNGEKIKMCEFNDGREVRRLYFAVFL